MAPPLSMNTVLSSSRCHLRAAAGRTGAGLRCERAGPWSPPAACPVSPGGGSCRRSFAATSPACEREPASAGRAHPSWAPAEDTGLHSHPPSRALKGFRCPSPTSQSCRSCKRRRLPSRETQAPPNLLPFVNGSHAPQLCKFFLNFATCATC